MRIQLGVVGSAVRTECDSKRPVAANHGASETAYAKATADQGEALAAMRDALTECVSKGAPLLLITGASEASAGSPWGWGPTGARRGWGPGEQQNK